MGGIKITRPNFHIIEGTNVNEQQLYTQFKHYYINHTDTSVPQIIKKLNITRDKKWKWKLRKLYKIFMLYTSL